MRELIGYLMVFAGAYLAWTTKGNRDGALLAVGIALIGAGIIAL